MEDCLIVELFWRRSESALSEAAEKYGAYCSSIARNILHSREDSEECVNDTYIKAWNSIPPQRPRHLGAYLGAITRNLALNRRRLNSAAKRGGGSVDAALDELSECVPSGQTTEKATDDAELGRLINKFVSEMKKEARIIFLKRYWYLCGISEISKSMGVSESRVKSALSRQRAKLRKFLEEEGVEL